MGDEDNQSQFEAAMEWTYAILDEATVQFPDQTCVVTQVLITMLISDERVDEAFLLLGRYKLAPL